jgi:hypothetical protein
MLRKTINRLKPTWLVFGALILLLAALLVPGALESGLHERPPTYAYRWSPEPPLLRVRLDDLNLNDKSVRYSLLPVNTERIMSTIRVLGSPFVYIEITADRNHWLAIEYQDWTEEIVHLPAGNENTEYFQSAVDIRSGYETRFPVRHKASFFYPYDQVEVSVTTAVVTVDTVDLSGCRRESHADLRVDATFPGWSMYGPALGMRTHYFRCHRGALLQEEDTGNAFIKLSRPWAYRVFTPLILICASGLIVGLCTVGLDGSFWEVVASTLFGLWGTREILLAPDVTWPTAIDILFLGLYLTTFLIVTWRTIGRLRATRNEPPGNDDNGPTLPGPAEPEIAKEDEARWAILALITIGIAAVLYKLLRRREQRKLPREAKWLDTLS